MRIRLQHYKMWKKLLTVPDYCFIKIHTSRYASSLKIENSLIHFPLFLQRETTCLRQTVYLAFQSKITGTIDLDKGTLSRQLKTWLTMSILKIRNYSKEVCQRTKQTDVDKRIPGKTESREEWNKLASNTNISIFVLNSAHTHNVALKQTQRHILQMRLLFTSTCKLGNNV